MTAAYGSLPFKEQIEFFLRKLQLPTERWTDIWQAAHDRAFVVAGAQAADLLDDLFLAVLKGIAEGTTLEEFRRDFDAIVKKHGWTGWTGEGTEAGVAWRTRVIYETNLRTSYAAGRWRQLQAVKQDRPYWLYRHNDSVLYPRPLHLSWDGKVLPADDPWWQTHFPPNGWGCKCRVFALDDRDLKKMGKDGPDPAPPSPIDPKTGAPVGIDTGWGYAPGANQTTPLQDLVAQKLFKLQAPIGAAMWEALRPAIAMETKLSWWNTLDEWLATDQRGRTATVGALTPEILAWLHEQQSIDPVSAEVTIREGLIRGAKQDRHEKSGDGLTPEEWRRLPEIIAAPEQVLFDTRTGKIVYVVSAGDEAGVKLVIEFDYKKKGSPTTNMIVSGFRQSSATIEQMIRGGLYEVLP